MKILIVEDEKLLADSLRAMLEGKGFAVEAVYDGETGAEYAETGVYDLLILDVMMPGLDGYQVARQVRARRCGTPILMLTARSSLEDRIEGLNAGADYYLTKPFDTRELLACIGALLRRQGAEVNELSYGNTALDLSSGTLVCGEKQLRLSAREFDVMRYLLQMKGQNVSKEAILARVWGFDSNAVENHVEVYVGFLRKKLKSIDPNGVLLGEVWEEATNKHSMGGRRKYVDGHELDSVMDYPFRRLLMDFFLGRIDGEGLARGLLRLMENYPPQFYESLLNLMGSHDVVRAITALSGAPERDALTKEQQAAYSPTIEQLDAGRKRFMAAAAVQYMMPGAPCLYYGDEAGLTGMADPFNRGTYPWGQEDTELIAYFQKLGELHKRAKGGCAFAGRGDVFALYRPEVICMVNRSCEPVTACFADKDFCGNIRAELENGCIERELPPYGAAILIKGQEERA